MITLYIILYFLLGTIISGAWRAYLIRNNDVAPETAILAILFWPIAIPYVIMLLSSKIMNHVMYAKEDRIKSVTNKLTGRKV